MIALHHMPQLSEAAARSLRRGGSPILWDAISRDIELGNAQAFFTSNGSYLVLRIDRDENELVILALSGNGAAEIMAACVHVCKSLGLKSVRFHTARKGLARLVKKFSPIEIERVYRVNVDEN